MNIFNTAYLSQTTVLKDLESGGIVANVERPATCKSACSSTIVREGDKCKYFDMTVGEIIDNSEFCEEGTVCNEKGGGGMVSIGGGPFFICTAVAEETPAPTTATATTVPATASTTAAKGSWTTMHGYIVDKLCASKGKGSKNPDGIDVFAAPEKHSLNCL